MSVTPSLMGGNPNGRVALDVDDVTVPMGESWFAGLQFDIDAFPGATALANGGFEDSAIGPAPSSWGSFGFGVNTTDVTPRSGAQCLALFEGIQFAGAGIFQRLPALAGQTWEFDGFVRTNAGDSIVGTDNFVLFAMIEFRSPDADAGATLRRSDCWENASPRVPPRAARRDDKASRFFYLLGTLYGEPKLSVTPNAASWISSCLLSWSSSSWSSS